MANRKANVFGSNPAGYLSRKQHQVSDEGDDQKQLCSLIPSSRPESASLDEIAGLVSDLQTEPISAAKASEFRGASLSQTAFNKALHAGSVHPPRILAQSDFENLNAILDYEISPNTFANYDVQWRSFCLWSSRRDVHPLPAEPMHVAAYLAERIEEFGHRPATLRVAAAAIAFVHRAVGMADPCAGPEVKRTLRSATRMAGRSQRQAEGLTAEALAAIRSTVWTPRRGRGGRLESLRTARSRGNLDIAMISVMRDAMLRVSEAAALKWGDLASEVDGTGRLLIRRSKADAEGEGVITFLSAATMATLASIRNGAADVESVFGLRPNQIARRIKRAAQVAGLGTGFSGHSPRVGMARDLARAGIELPSLMTAGRWRTPKMPAHYIRKETAGKGAVAQFYGYHRPAT